MVLNIKKLRILALFAAVFAFGAISSSNANAVSYDTYTDSDGVVWDRETNDDGDIYIGIKSVPSGITTVNVPSINDVASGKDTYFLDSICSRYTTPDCSGVVSDTANVTVLDMTNASGIQIRNVSQMFDTNHEVELVFGENVVIADPADLDLPDGYDPTDLSYRGSVYAAPANTWEVVVINPYDSNAGAFDGMAVKLTGLSNVKYLGWNAFRNTTLNADSRNITINSNQTVGGYVFAGSNIESLTIDTAEVGQGFASGCTSLSSLTIGDNVTTLYAGTFYGTTNLVQALNTKNIVTIGEAAFKNSGLTSLTFGTSLEVIDVEAFRNVNLGSVDFANTNVQYIKAGAFANANLSAVNFKNSSLIHISSYGFANNQTLEEVYLPKTFRATVGTSFAYYIFRNTPIKNLTLAFDLTTMPQGGNIAFLLDGGGSTWYGLEQITVLAPYGDDEEVPSWHNYDIAKVMWSSAVLPDELTYSMKNIIPWGTFYWGGDTTPLKLVLDDRIEMIGTGAFNWGYLESIKTIDADGNISEDNRLPSHLKAIGTHAFEFAMTSKFGGNHPGESSIIEMDSLPASLEFIGECAFIYDNDFILDTLDLPNLKYLGRWAFYYSNVKNITLHAAPASNDALFMGSHIVETITIDYDYWGTATNPSFGTFSCWGDFNCSVEPGPIGLTDNKQHFTKVKFTSKATTAPYGGLQFQGIYTDELDLSETPWTVLYQDTDSIYGPFIGAKIGTLKLPHKLEYINKYSFNHADIENPVVIPDTVTEIGQGAFNASPLWQRWSTTGEWQASSNIYGIENFTPGVKITALPASIEKIGDGAFYMDDRFEADVNLPNLTEIGDSAFVGTHAKNVVLNDGITKLGANVFYDVPTLNDVTIDMNIYEATRPYGSGKCIAPGSETSVSFGSDVYSYCGDGYRGFLTDEEYDNTYYDSFVATFGNKSKFGTITFTENAGEPCGGFSNCSKERGYFYGIKADKVDISATNWTATSASMFQDAEVGEVLLPHALATINPWTFYSINAAAATEGSDVEPVSIAIPSTLKEISYEGFMRAQAEIDGLPEGLTTIINSAFYEADVTDDLVIPSTVTLIGSSAFNAGSADVTYNNVTIKPDLTMHNSAGQLIFQMFWNAKITNKLIISSSMLPALYLDQQGVDMTDQPEFHGMTMKEAVITNLPKITAQAFEECANLERVDLSSDSHLRAIEDKAFYNDTKLGTILFSPSIKNEVVTVGSFAFKGTAFKTMGDNTKQFDLSAAKFDASAGSAFAEMPLLETLDVPRTFSNLTIPVATFANDPELRLVNIDYKLDTIDDHAFSNDNKLESIFIWGNTQVEDSVIAGHGASTDGENGIYGGVNDQGRGAGEYGPTIPEPTDIYAYSTSRAEDYAALPVRGTFEGDFYPLDEVLYLTSNKPTVLVNDDATDFDKSDLIVYAMRRDGIILESDSWATYDGNAYQRATSDVDFEAMAAAIQENPVFASIHDTPVPMDELDVTTNVNFENIDFTMVPDPDDSTVRKIVLLYNDKYTDNLADTDIIPYQEGGEVEPPVPDTGAKKAVSSIATIALPTVTMATISVLAGILIYRKRRS